MKISDLKTYTVTAEAIPALTTPEAKKSFIDKVFGVSQVTTDFLGGKGVTDLAGATLANTMVKPEDRKNIQYPSAREVAGSAIQLGALAIPGAGEAGLVGKVAAGLGTGYALDVGSKLQDKAKTTGEALTPGVGTAIGGSLPIVGAVVKPAVTIVGRLLKGLGSGLSGVSTKTIETIVDNPQKALEVSKKLAQSGNSKILEENAKKIINGVSAIRQEARKAFGEGLESLSSTDIKPTVFRTQTQNILNKYGVSLKDGVRKLSGVEFDDPKNIAKASDLIDRLSNVQLNGKALRKLSDDIESSAYKIATTDERLSFNSFVNDLADSLKTAISNSTDKLNEINKNFSQDMQLTEAAQNIFGKVNFKNLPEVVRASQRLENLFAQKGLAPEVVDQFLKRIGENPASFKTSEAVRQISNKSTGANTKGLSFGEGVQQLTSAIVTPKMVKTIATYTGMAEQKVIPLLNRLKPAARNILIEAIIQGNQEDSK